MPDTSHSAGDADSSGGLWPAIRKLFDLDGGEPAVGLFREVLAASASLPGLFPPRRIPCEVDGDKFEEMHVDGGTMSQVL